MAVPSHRTPAGWAVVLLALVLAPSVLLQIANAEDAGSSAPAQKPLEVGSLQLSLLSPTGSTVISGKGSYPKPVLSLPQVSLKHSLEVTFSVTARGGPAEIQQAFLSLVHQPTGAAVYGVGKAKKDGITYTAALPFSAIVSQIGKQPGEYKAVLLVGGPEYDSGVHWDLGPLEVVLEAGETPTSAVRTARVQPMSSARPPIYHQFRPADKRPPVVVSMAFTGLAVLPLLAVLGYVAFGLRANGNGWPRTASTSLAATLFHGLLAAMLGIYLAFWRSWTLAETLPMIFIVGAPLALFGHKALSGLASERLAAKKD